MPIRWDLADDYLLDIAKSIIRDHHPKLLEAKIGFMYRSSASYSAGKVILGHAKKVSDDMQVFIDFDFIIWIAQTEFGRMEYDQQRALVDHELCHCIQDPDTGNWKIKKHDFEEFYAIIERHGLWTQDLKFAGQVIKEAKQPVLIEFSSSRGGVATLTSEQLARMAKGQFTHQEARAMDGLVDELLEEAKALVDENGEVSIAKIQRELRIGYTRAAKIRDLILTAQDRQD